MIRFLFALIFAVSQAMPAVAGSDPAPWGVASPAADTDYAPQHVVYDVTADTPEDFELLLDRMSGLSAEYDANPFDASIVAVLHGPEMAFFDVRRFKEFEDLVRRAQSLTVGGIIELRMCERAAARLRLKPENIHGFIEMVPMGDAEIVRLQKEGGYAYMK